MFGIVKVLFIFGVISLSLSYDSRISIRDIATCRHEYKHIANSEEQNFQNFLPLTSFLYGIRPHEKRLNFYFKGQYKFKILLSKKPEMPSNQKEDGIKIGKFFKC